MYNNISVLVSKPSEDIICGLYVLNVLSLICTDHEQICKHTYRYSTAWAVFIREIKARKKDGKWSVYL